MGDGISRRNFAKHAGLLGAGAGAASLAGCSDDGGNGGGGGDGGDGGGLSDGERPVKWLGTGSLSLDPQSEKFTEVTGVDIELTTATEPEVVQQVLSGANETFDAAVNSAHSGSAMTLANPTTVPVPVDDLDKWQEDWISEIFLEPSEGLPAMGEQAEVLSEHLWADPEEKTELLMPPHVFNLDAIAINPAQVDRSNNTWSAMYDDQFQGQVAACDVAIIGALPAMMHCKDNGIIDIDLANLNNPSEDQIDQLIDFLVAEKRAGQFRATWQTYGNSVNIFASGEAVVGDLWQPAVYDVRAEGTPCIYATHPNNTVQGEMFWFGGIMPLDPGTRDRNNWDEVLALIEDVHWGAWFPRFTGATGYMTPNFPRTDLVRDGSDETGEGMGPEFYDWSYEGTATYQDIENPDLFVPADYDWSMEEGSPSDDGKVRDGGPLSDRLDRTTSMWIFPDNGPYLQEEWERFRSA